MLSTLLNNGYPFGLLNEKIFEHYKKLIANLHKTNQVCEIYEIDFRESRKVITLPCIQNFQEQLCRILKKTKLQIIFTIENTFHKKMFPTLKDRTQNNFNIMLFTKLIALNVIKNILAKLADSYTTDCLNMVDQLKIKKIKPHLQNTLLPINIPFILKIQKF